MKYAVDRIEENIVVLENIDTKDKLEANLNELDFEIKDGDIIIFDGKKYINSKTEYKSRIDIIREKMKRVKKQ